MRRSSYTKKKQEVDDERDELFVWISSSVRLNLKHFDPSIREAALLVNNMLISYENVTQMNYDAETATIDSIISRSRNSSYAPAFQLMDLVPWVNLLEVKNNKFKEYAEDASLEKQSKPDISQKEARKLTDKALSRITDRVEAIAIFDGYEAVAGFAVEFNSLVKHYNTLVHEHYGRTHTQVDITVAEVAPIAPQAFVGKPIPVIPELLIREVDSNGVESVTELVFSEDFTLTYRDNTNPGLATIIISGAGKYKGERIVTFNIERTY